MKKILVPTDFSEQSEYAMQLACQIIERQGVKVIVLHILDLAGYVDFSSAGSSYTLMGNPIGIGFDEKIISSLHQNSSTKMEAFLAGYSALKEHITSKIEFGNAYQTITNEIEAEDIDLVIMGSKGTDGIEEFLIGSNTEKVVRHAKCPVLTVKSKINVESVNEIAFASNFTEDESHVADDLKKLQEVFKAKIHLVRINTPNNFETTRQSMKLMENFVKENDLANYTLNIYNDIVEEDGIIYFAEDKHVDMIAMATHGRSGLIHLLSGSIAEDVVNHAKRPVWTFRLKHK